MGTASSIAKGHERTIPKHYETTMQGSLSQVKINVLGLLLKWIGDQIHPNSLNLETNVCPILGILLMHPCSMVMDMYVPRDL